MQAVVSGRSGVALLLEGDEIRSLHAETGEIVRRKEREIPYLLGDATDLLFLENVEIPDVAQRLEVATAQADALHLALLLLDPQLPHDVRRDAADELAELLKIDGVRESVENVLLSHPLPNEADLPGALSCCPGRAEASRAFLLRIQALQGEVRDVFFAWQDLPEPVFEDERNRAFALSTAIRQGFFRLLVNLRAEHRSVDDFMVEALRNAAFSRARNHRDILRDWLAPLREPKPSAPMLHAAFDRRDQVAEVGDEAATVCILLVRGENPAGTQTFAYVAVRADKLSEFMKAQESGMFYPEDFGIILASGEGKPSEEIRRTMQTEYGFDHDGMIDIPDADERIDESLEGVLRPEKD